MAIDPTNGALNVASIAGSQFAAAPKPLGIAVDPSGQFVYVANSGSRNVSAYVLNRTSGSLTAVTGSPFAAGTGPTAVTTTGWLQ